MIDFDTFVSKVCERNNTTRDQVPPEKFEKLKSMYVDMGGTIPTVHTMTGYEALAKKQGSVENAVQSINEEEELKELRRKNQLRKAKEEKAKYEEIDDIKQGILEEDITDVKADIEEMKQDVQDRDEAIEFLFPETEDFITLAPGSVSLFCAPTGNGKSTLCAATAETLVSAGKRVLVLANEEKGADVRARVSCIRTGISYARYKQKKGLDQADYEKVWADSRAIEKNVIVYTNKTKRDSYRTCNKDGIVTTLEQATGKFDLIIIDYWQRVVKTDSNPEANWEAQRALAPELDRLKKIVGCPIMVFAQIHPIVNAKKEPEQRAANFDKSHPYYRWKGSTEILFTATDVVEFAKDREESCTHLFAHKVRFIHPEWEQYYVLGFNIANNTYCPRTLNYQIDEIEEKVKEDEDGSD